MTLDRLSGLLLHVTSLPGRHGIGDLGPAAYRFVDFLDRAEQRVWQVLPLVPLGFGYSPYSSPSTFAGNPLLVSPERLIDAELLTRSDLEEESSFSKERVEYDRVVPFRRRLLERAFERFERGNGRIDEGAFEAFRDRERDWLDDYALFATLKNVHDGAPWPEWPDPLSHRHPDALEEARGRYRRDVRMRSFWQFLFHRQWQALHAYCREREIRIFGDLPIYVAHDSADVWSRQDLFRLDEDGRAEAVAGVPPDYFSETGQRWGNPLYRWDRMTENGYRWWTRRFARTLQLVDVLRIDHFRGFESYWEIPAEEETAVDGRWREGPRAALFDAVRAELDRLPVIAEDLGLITPEVTDLMDELGFPGMAVVQFGFGDGPSSTHMPHHYPPDKVAYTGTHDNDTIVGWWASLAERQNGRSETRSYVRDYLDLTEREEERLHWRIIRLVMGSSARWSIFPVQDVLGLGSEARMNTPGDGTDNWRWRLPPDRLDAAVADRLARWTDLFDRHPPA